MYAISVNDRIVKKDLTENEAVELAKKESISAGSQKVYIFLAKSYVVNQPVIVDLVLPDPLVDVKKEEIQPEILPVKKEFPERGKMEFKELLDEFLNEIFKTDTIQEVEEIVSKYSCTALVESNIFKDSIKSQTERVTKALELKDKETIKGRDGKDHIIDTIKEKLSEKYSKAKNQKEIQVIYDSTRYAYPGIELAYWYDKLFSDVSLNLTIKEEEKAVKISAPATGGLIFNTESETMGVSA